MTAPPHTETARTHEEEGPTMTSTELALPNDWTAGSPTTSRRRPVSRRAAALRSEWIKFTTVRTNKVILAVAFGLGLLVSWASAAFVTDQDLARADVYIFPTLLTSVLAAIAGVLLFTSEVQHGTLAAAVTAQPARRSVVVAKAVVAGGYGLVLGAVGMTTGLIGALAGGIEVGDTAGVPTAVLWALLYTSGSGLLGLGVGMIVRHSAGAVSGVLVWWLVVESLIIQFAPAEVVHFLPFDAGFRTLGVESDFDSPEIVASALSNPTYATIFLGYVTAALVAGWVLLHRRDID
jgi:ABC-2 type transport system permease protein